MPTRSEFLFQGPAAKAVFYLLMAAALGAFALQVWGRVKLWRQGKPITWKPDYVGSVVTYVLGQRKVRSSRPRSGAPMHLLIFYGFLTLFIGTTLLGINTYSPWKFHYGAYYLTYEFALDIMGVAFIVGVGWAFFRRLLAKPKSLTSAPPDYFTLAILFVLGITGFMVEAARMSANPKPFDTSAPVGHWLAGLAPGIFDGAYVGIWWFHAVLVAVFIAIVPQLRLRHIAYAILSTAGRNPNGRMGELPIITMEEVEQSGKIGASSVADYSRWHLMSLDACMECGRCTEVCPAWRVGKALNPKEVVQSIRGALSDGRSVAESVGEEALWQCTTCNACVEVCPVSIRHVDLIVDARRHLVAEGALRGTAATMLRQLQSTESAWGTPASEREKWMEGRDIPLARDLLARGEKFDVLLWVGCAGAVDKAAMKTTQDFARLLKKAGVTFACLGIEERCTGDSARRTGDEFLFQQMAEQNVATFAQYGVTTIVTACPHCFNTLKNEYPALGGHYAVMHHSQFLAQLISEGRLKAPTFADGSVTLHDPCYLARVNNEADAPRAALGAHSNYNDHQTPVDKWLTQPIASGNQLVEPTRHAQKTLCCGAGGGRMWMEEEVTQRPSDARVKELAATGAKTVAVACPFCRIMLDAGIQSSNQHLDLVDIAELIGNANND